MNIKETVKLCNQLLLFAKKQATIIRTDKCLVCSEPVEDHEICICGWEEDPYIMDGFSYANHELLEKAQKEWISK